MDGPDVAGALQDMMIVVLKLGGPALLAALLAGTVMSLVQTVTQINEPTLAFLPKAAVILGTLALTGPFMLATLSDYAAALFDRMVLAGGQ